MPQKGNEPPAQGVALGNGVCNSRPQGAKALTDATLIPFQGEGSVRFIHRALPWAIRSLAFLAAHRAVAAH